MNEVIDLLASDLGSIRTGRANPAIVQDMEIRVYGGTQKLKVNEMATVTTPDANTIIIDPWDKSIIGEISKGIAEANVGLNPSQDEEIIRITVPPMTQEDRQKFVKLLSTKLENVRIMVRQIRGDFMRDIKNSFEEKSITEDEKFNQEKKLQSLTDDYNQKISDIGEKKEKELLQV